MTTFEKTWQIDMNRATGQANTTLTAQYMLWFYKAFIQGDLGGATTGLWTPAGSSDGTTAAMDGVDRWTNTFNAAKIVQAAAGVAHSWYVAKSPVGLGPFYMCIDCDSASAVFDVFFSKTAFTGGSTTARPTSTTEWGYTNQNLRNVVLGKTHAMMASDGSNWHIHHSTNGSGFDSTLSFMQLLDTKAADNHNGWLYYNFTCLWLAGTGALSDTTQGLILGRDANNTITVKAFALIQAGNANPPNPVFTYMTGTDETDGAYADLPIYIAVSFTLTGTRGEFASVRGRLPDVRWSPSGLNAGDTEPNPSTPAQSMIVKTGASVGCWFPANAVPSI